MPVDHSVGGEVGLFLRGRPVNLETTAYTGTEGGEQAQGGGVILLDANNMN